MAYQLYTFSASHYCEKARWALQYKGLEFEEIVLVPLLHLFKVKRLKVAKTWVPILQGEGSLIQGSTEIIRWLERRHPTPSLIPWSPSEEARAQEIDTRLDKLGIHVRRFVYWHLMPHRRLALQALGNQAHGYAKTLLPWIFPMIKLGIFKGLNITATSVQSSLEKIKKGLQWLEELRNGRQYLLGEKFSLLDLSAASLLAPFSLPPEHPVYSQLEIPEEVLQELEQFQGHPALIWVDGLYRNYRRSVQVTK